MVNEQKKVTAQTSSVGADGGQSHNKSTNTTIPEPQTKNNPEEEDYEEFFRQLNRMQDPSYLHTVTMEDLMDCVFQKKTAIIENLLYPGVRSEERRVGKECSSGCSK